MRRWYVLKWVLGDTHCSEVFQLDQVDSLITRFRWLKKVGSTPVIYETKETEVTWSIGGNGG
jgi:hypothetical protein